MVDIRAVGLLAAILAVRPAFAEDRAATRAADASRLKEADRLERQGETALASGNYAVAGFPLRAALTIREETLGPDHPDTLRSLDEIAAASLATGEGERAEALYKRVLAAREKALGPDHPAVADDLHALANAYIASDDVERIERSLPLFARAADIRARALGPDSPRVAESINRMAVTQLWLAQRAGRFRVPALLDGIRRASTGSARPRLPRREYLDQAERGLKRTLAIREKSSGPDDRVVAFNLQNLAAVYAEGGRFAEAEPLMKRSLALFEKAMGPDHPITAASLDYYARILGKARGDAEARAEVRALSARARSIRDRQVRRASTGPARGAPPAR